MTSLRFSGAAYVGFADVDVLEDERALLDGKGKCFSVVDMASSGTLTGFEFEFEFEFEGLTIQLVSPDRFCMHIAT